MTAYNFFLQYYPRPFENFLFVYGKYLRLRRTRTRYLLISLLLILFLFVGYIFGLFTRLLEIDFETSFAYPLHLVNFRYLIETVKGKSVVDGEGYGDSNLIPLNNYSFSYRYDVRFKCNHSYDIDDNHHRLFGSRLKNSSAFVDPITLLIVIKSAVENLPLRLAIRNSWGYERRFSDVKIRTIFVLGQCPTGIYQNSPFSTRCQTRVDSEQRKFHDLVQADFVDSYYNNTLKTLASLEWTARHCTEVPFVLFVDDDYYVSIKNLLKFVRNFLQDPTVNIDDGDPDDASDSPGQQKSSRSIATHFDGRLYTGFVFPSSRPMRHLTSKWYISLSDYPYSRYPPYVTGGCYLVNNRTVIDLYYASLYTKRFKYDDVYLGILAHKMSINLIHNQQMYFYKLPYYRETYGEVISSHGYHDPIELSQIWLEQKSLGNA